MYRKFIYGKESIFKKPDVSNVVVEEGFEYPYQPGEKIELEMVDKGSVSVYAALSTASIRETEKQIRFLLTTKAGPIGGMCWKSGGFTSGELKRESEESSVLLVKGSWNEWPKGSGQFSINVTDVMPSDKTIEEIVNFIDDDGNELIQELFYYIGKMSEENRSLTKEVLKEVWGDFIFAPAARGMHHHQFSGLLQHTVENMRIAYHFMKQPDIKSVAELTEKIDRFTRRAMFLEHEKFLEGAEPGTNFFSKFEDNKGQHSATYLGMTKALQEQEEFGFDYDVVMFSVLFHDIGKIMEYSYAESGSKVERYNIFFPNYNFKECGQSVGADMDPQGVRLGHITLGIIFLSRVIAEKGGKNGEFLIDVLSAVSSHHGRLEWGSPTTPNTSNEYLVHLVDLLGSAYASEKVY